MASTSSAQTLMGADRPSLRPTVSSRMNLAFSTRSVEEGGIRNVVQDEHLEEIEAIKRYEVGYYILLLSLFLVLSCLSRSSLCFTSFRSSLLFFFFVPLLPLIIFSRTSFWALLL